MIPVLRTIALTFNQDTILCVDADVHLGLISTHDAAITGFATARTIESRDDKVPLGASGGPDL